MERESNISKEEIVLKYKRITLIVLDSVGIGELPDAKAFGDCGAHTLKHIAEQIGGLHLPNMQSLGLGCIEQLRGLAAAKKPAASYGKMKEASAGKDTMTGHWELMGLKVEVPFQTYPNGFPNKLLELFTKHSGRGVLGNKPASGTEIIAELGEQQMNTGDWIVYTSADSVFQLAAHEEVIPLDELYAACKWVREQTRGPKHAVGRVIARPYVGKPGAFERTSNRHDYALKPPAPTTMNALKESQLDCIAVGKINDIFSGEGVTQALPTKSNYDGIEQTISMLKHDFAGLLFTNLVDFDSKYGHRRDPAGYAKALQEFDEALPRIMEQLTDQDMLIITADHGNDPTFHGTDHTREYVPLLVYGPHIKQGVQLGIRDTFSDVAATIADNFGVEAPQHGKSFLSQL